MYYYFRAVPLYEYIVTWMCAFAAIHSPEQFHVIVSSPILLCISSL